MTKKKNNQQKPTKGKRNSKTKDKQKSIKTKEDKSNPLTTEELLIIEKDRKPNWKFGVTSVPKKEVTLMLSPLGKLELSF